MNIAFRDYTISVHILTHYHFLVLVIQNPKMNTNSIYFLLYGIFNNKSKIKPQMNILKYDIIDLYKLID